MMLQDDTLTRVMSRNSVSGCLSRGNFKSNKISPATYSFGTPSPSSDKLELVTNAPERACTVYGSDRVVKPRKSLVHLVRSWLLRVSCLHSGAMIDTTDTLGRHVTGTLFGFRRGHMSFVVQNDPRSEPALVLVLPISTSTLVKEMSTGLIRITLDCRRVRLDRPAQPRRRLLNEPMWTMHCNGRNCGYSVSRACTEAEWRVLSAVQTVSVGAGVIPCDAGDDAAGDMFYMRARFERAIGCHDSEAFYMLNPDGNGAEFSIFLMRS